jgi:putative DNA primase/helicase
LDHAGLTPRPYSFGSATAAIFRVIDREKPTLLGDNVDTLFQRKPDLTEVYSVAYTRGLKIPRAEKMNGEWITRWYDPFCPKAVTLVGMSLPEALLGRSIVIELWKMKPGETVEKVDPLNSALMDAFKTLRRKLRRWADDHAAALKAARPTMPTAFINRPADNWILLWAIGDSAGDEWGQLARDAAERLSEAGIVEPSWLERLTQELWTVFVEEQHDRIPSGARSSG